MLGTILGDIIGSRFEFMGFPEKEMVLFKTSCSWTDDTIMTFVVSQVCDHIKQNNILDENEIEELFVAGFKKAVRDFPKSGWRKGFLAWATSKEYLPYESTDNNCLMCISPIILYFKDLNRVQQIGRICTKVTHNHPESYHAVETLLEIFHYLFHSNTRTAAEFPEISHVAARKEAVKQIAIKHGIVIESVQEYHQQPGYWALAKETLPRSLAAYLEGKDFETVMKNLIYVGSETHTTATIGGGLAELTYSLDSLTLQNIYRYFDYKSFPIVQQICRAYTQEDNKEFFNNLFKDSAQAKIHELIAHKAINPTAQWDPLELPSIEEYYKLEPGFSWKKLMVKLFGKC